MGDCSIPARFIHFLDDLVRVFALRSCIPGLDGFGLLFHLLYVEFGLLVDGTEDLLDVIEADEFARLGVEVEALEVFWSSLTSLPVRCLP